MVKRWLDVGPDDFEIAEVFFFRVLGDLANLLLVNLFLTRVGSPTATAA